MTTTGEILAAAPLVADVPPATCRVIACAGKCGRPFEAPTPPAIEPPPTPMERAEVFARSFSGFANEYAMLFGGPIYLVGSCLTSAAPGDIDLRLQLDRETCVLYWGEEFDGPSWKAPRGWLARKREELKQSRRITRTFRGNGPRIDFQFQCALFSSVDGEPIGHDGKPRLRLDAIPRELFEAGRGEP